MTAVRCRRLALAVVAIVALPAAAAAQSDADLRRAAAREVIHASGADSAAVHAIEIALPAQRAANPQVPAAFWDEFLLRARKKLPELIDSLAPIYAGHFTLAELQQLRAFYESPIGRRLVAEQGGLQEQSTRIGQRWGAILGADVAADLTRQGKLP